MLALYGQFFDNGRIFERDLSDLLKGYNIIWSGKYAWDTGVDKSRLQSFVNKYSTELPMLEGFRYKET